MRRLGNQVRKWKEASVQLPLISLFDNVCDRRCKIMRSHTNIDQKHDINTVTLILILPISDYYGKSNHVKPCL